MENKDINLSKDNIKNIETRWNNIKKIFACYIEHNELNKIETSFTICKSFTQMENFEMAISKLDETIFVLEHMHERYMLNLENIF